MKKTFLIAAAALAMGSAAIAQDMPAQTPPPAAPASDMQAPPPAPAPDGTAATPPAAPVAQDSATPAPTPADTSSYPTCSRGVTDKCVQKGGATHKKTMHHPKK